MKGLIVEKAGIFTLIQDIGRYKYTHLGVSPSGFLDEYAAFWANKLLGNSVETNLLEITFSNVVLKATSNMTISITGAFCELFINEIQKPTWRSYNIKAEDTIKIGKFSSGSRVYLAVKNGFGIKKEFESYSTSIKEGLGGLNGDKLKNGDFLPISSNLQCLEKRVREDFIPSYENEIRLRVVLSYQYKSFSKKEQEKFFNSSFDITSDFNRMACKLKGEKIVSSLNGIVSEGISFGSIQIPSDGQPIILLKDRQTIGGYPKIGSVLPIDCFKLAQTKIGSKVKFEKVEIQEAQKKLKDFYSIFI